MQTNRDQVLKFTEQREGGYSCRRDDDGNWTGGRRGRGRLVGTMRGISAPAMVSWTGLSPDLVTVEMMRSITPDLYRRIATVHYWNPLWCDHLPDGVDLMMFDYGFNAGVHGALSVLASLYGSLDRTDVMTEQLMSRVLTVPEIVLSRMIAGDLARDMQRILHVDPDGVIGPVTLAAISERHLENLLTIYALGCAQDRAYRQMCGWVANGTGWIGRLHQRVEIAAEWASASACPGA